MGIGSEQTRAILAVVISGIVLIGYQYFFAPKMAPMPAPDVTVSTSSEVKVVDKSAATSGESSLVNEKAGGKPGAAVVAGTTFDVARVISGKDAKNVSVDNSIKYSITSPVGVKKMENSGLKVSFDKLFGFEGGANLSEGELPFSIQVLEGDKYVPINLLKESGADSGKIISAVNEQGIAFNAEITDDGRLKFAIKSNNTKKFRFLIRSRSGEIAGRGARQFILLDQSVERINVGDDDKGEKQIKWFGVDFDFHMFTVVFSEPKSVTYATDKNGLLDIYTNSPYTDIEGTIVYAKKNYDDLATMGDNLKLAVDFGIFGILAVPILRCLQFFYKFIPNYGIAIIFLTLLLRIVTFPLQNKSYKSMKRMQDIRPEIEKVKEKFKDDPQRMQKETMELFKREKVNPFGGCFPLLIQLPIFIAFYQVLFNAVELIEAPFFWWVKDLSAKDPYYILPVLMTIAMYIQQKMTPATGLDATQQKVMMFMPLVFGFIMKDLPSGLALYIFVSTVLGIIQQLVVYRTK
ncbi:MAG: membrane protein insertase YidC [Oligoflexia bacterium]|nr:membrane protein insertase YidC [Oligoflexia bacterium]